MKPKNATIRDVARAAGVSISTVSRVLNQRGVLSEEIRDKVLRAVKKYHYVPQKPGRKSRHPNAAPKRRSRATRILGLLLSSGIMKYYAEGDPYYGRLLGGIYQAVDRVNYHLMVGLHDKDKHALPSLVTQNKVDGLLIDEQIPEAIQEQLAARLPVVYIDKGPIKTDASSVEVNLQAAIRDILSFLWNLGHRDVACFIPDDAASQAGLFADTYGRFFAEKGYRPRMDVLNVPRDINEKTHAKVLAEYIREILNAPVRPTAVISWDAYLITILSELKHLGVRVPEDMSIVGIDDTPAALQVDPQLSSYRFPLNEMGRMAVEVLLQKIADPTRTPCQILLKGELIARGSSGPAPVPVAGSQQ